MGWTSCDSRPNVLLAVFVLLAITPIERTLSAEQFYGASLSQSKWTLFIEPGRCELTHDIPRYGHAVFKKAADDALQFSLHVMQPPIEDGSAHLVSTPPPWEHDIRERDLGRITIIRGTTPIVWERDQSLRLFYELENGMFPYLRYRDWGDGRDQVIVAISPIRFREVLPEFLACNRFSRELYSAAAEESLVHFDTASSELRQADSVTLASIAKRFLAEGPRFHSIIIGGHADRRGTSDYNHKLSMHRATAVADFLKSHGVAANSIDIRYYGETLPLEDGDDEVAWSKNRRVSIWLTSKPKEQK